MFYADTLMVDRFARTGLFLLGVCCGRVLGSRRRAATVDRSAALSCTAPRSVTRDTVAVYRYDSSHWSRSELSSEPRQMLDKTLPLP